MATYYGQGNASGASVYSGQAGPVTFAQDRRATAYVVRDGQGDSELYARIDTPTGAVLKTIEVKEDSDLNYDPAVAALNGRFAVTWTNSDDDDPATDTQVLARVYNANGTPASSLLTISTHANRYEGREDESSVAATGKGFVVVFENDTAHDVRATVVTPAGTGWSKREIVVDRTVGASGGDPVVTRATDGDFIVTYTDANEQTTTRRYNPDGSPDGARSGLLQRPLDLDAASPLTAGGGFGHLTMTAFGGDHPIGHDALSLTDPLVDLTMMAGV